MSNFSHLTVSYLYSKYHGFGETALRTYQYKRYSFNGKEKDEHSGFYYYGMRYYAPWMCRFVSVDPLAGKYKHYTPYQYAGNKPISKVDIDGLEENDAKTSGDIEKTSDNSGGDSTPKTKLSINIDNLPELDFSASDNPNVINSEINIQKKETMAEKQQESPTATKTFTLKEAIEQTGFEASKDLSSEYLGILGEGIEAKNITEINKMKELWNQGYRPGFTHDGKFTGKYYQLKPLKNGSGYKNIANKSMTTVGDFQAPKISNLSSSGLKTASKVIEPLIDATMNEVLYRNGYITKQEYQTQYYMIAAEATIPGMGEALLAIAIGELVTDIVLEYGAKPLLEDYTNQVNQRARKNGFDYHKAEDDYWYEGLTGDY